MKKILAAVVILGIGGAGVAFAWLKSPERAACIKVADLCGMKDGGKAELDQCVDQIKQWRKVGGDEPVDKGLVCVDEAKSCGEAMGCASGAAFKGMQGVMTDFIKGFGKAQ